MYDLKEIKAIPIGDVAQQYGLNLKLKGNRLWGKLRETEKTDSFSINLKDNLWYDFGSGKGGSVIDLVAELERISSTEAINRLAEQYGFKAEKTAGWRCLTDSQYREIGIQPERATLNFGFDLEKHSVEQLTRWSEKYGMPVKDLAQAYPKVYNQMVNKISLGQIEVLRDVYQARINMFHDPTMDDETKRFLDFSARNDAVEIKRKVELIQRAIKPLYEGQKIDLSNYLVHPDKDLKEKAKDITTSVSDDQKIRDHIVKVYKKLFNYSQVEHFTVEQAKALQDINKAIVNGDNKYIPIDGIKKTYDKLGQGIERLESEYGKLMTQGEAFTDLKSTDYSEWATKVKAVESELSKVKALFNKCNTVIEGIRGADLVIKDEKSKTQAVDKQSDRGFDMSQ